MKGAQGDIFWRAAFVNLDKFDKVYQIRFKHTLPEGNCFRSGSQQCTICKYQKCPAANVAIDGIRLDCLHKANEKVPVEVCKSRAATLCGCEILADMPLATGESHIKSFS